MKMWAGRFEGEADELANQFNQSLSFDKRLALYDIEGSLAHVKMLARQGILSSEDGTALEAALLGLKGEIESGLDIVGDYEDIHMAVEEILTSRIGDAAKRMHTARSRNDQVALDMKMYVKDEIKALASEISALIGAFRETGLKHLDSVMPGYTHLQQAQPITLAFYLAAYIEMFLRDRSRLEDCLSRMDTMPLGAGALASSTFDIDRFYVAEQLGFSGPSANSLDSVSDRDYVLELLSCLSILMMHYSRLCEEIILWSTEEFGFVTLSDAYTTGSSMMPQKKNPDMAELVRGKTGRVFGALLGMLTVMKGLPLAYDKDMQEDKESTFDALDTAHACTKILAAVISTAAFHTEKMRLGVQSGFLAATDLADYLAKKGMPFRDAHFVIGSLVKDAIKQGRGLASYNVEELKRFSGIFEEDALDVLNAANSVNQKTAYGSPNPYIVKEYLESVK